MYQKSSDLRKYLIISIYIDFLRFYFPFFCIHWLMGYNLKPRFFFGGGLCIHLTDWTCDFFSACFAWFRCHRYSFKSLCSL